MTENQIRVQDSKLHNSMSPKEKTQTVFIVDDDAELRSSLTWMLKNSEWKVQAFESAQAFLDGYSGQESGCLLLDIRMPNMTGLELQQELKARRLELPTIIISGHADVPLAVLAIKQGAMDVIEKPFDRLALINRISEAMNTDGKARGHQARLNEISERHQLLTPREVEVFELLIKGLTTKEIAWKLDVSARTVEKHRERVMRKMQVDSAAELILLAVEGEML